ncbi:hypothetical protein MF672_048585 [Actinomadura sp. ATCC 31491]|uniref:Transcriptional regulator n=1 Tax=Actinomadura luzonensis TaxID=2805427 RepID=A0ABT0GAI9_9ACTN|nr:hypothetical protein [Actinomadura luzonensis]MCK2221612.1 hypothetical protein [Actinomadura luzonensis]
MALPPLHEGLADKVPDSLADLRGPAEGVVALPPWLAWSGLTEFDLSQFKIRMEMYRIVITTGRRVDYETYLNADLLMADWPLLRRGLGPAYRHAWENKLPLRRERVA